MGFQTQVNQQPAPAVEGDFASVNPRHSLLTQEGGGFVAGPAGVVVARFVWADPATWRTLNNGGVGLPVGFVHREQQGLITAWLGEGSMLVPAGLPLTAHDAADFWVRNNGSAECTPGMKAFAAFADGKVSFGAAGSASAVGGQATGTIAAATFSVTASIAAPAANSAVGSIMAVTAVGSGTVVPGATISGTNVVTGTKVASQLLPLAAGEALGGVGRYYVDTPQTVAATTVSGAYGLFTAVSAATGVLGVGQVLSGTGVTAGTQITALGTGAGGLGTYIVSPSQTASSAVISGAASIETKWYAKTFAAAGELVKMSSVAPG